MRLLYDISCRCAGCVRVADEYARRIDSGSSDSVLRGWSHIARNRHHAPGRIEDPIAYADWVLAAQESLSAMLPVGWPFAWALTHPQLERRGAWLEFGVWEGETLSRMAAVRGDARVVGFDSFLGLPEDWIDGHPRGKFSRGGRPPEISGAEIVVGMFADTVPAFTPPGPVTFVHVDCDLYASASVVLQRVAPMLSTGAFVVFDELAGHDGYELDEMRALHEAAVDGLRFDWVARCQKRDEVVIRIK